MIFNSSTRSKPEQTKTVTPTAAGVTVTPDDGKVLSSVMVNGDADLIAENIKAGVDIFGVVGTMTAGAEVVRGIVTSGTKSTILSIPAIADKENVIVFPYMDVSIQEGYTRVIFLAIIKNFRTHYLYKISGDNTQLYASTNVTKSEGTLSAGGNYFANSTNYCYVAW